MTPRNPGRISARHGIRKASAPPCARHRPWDSIPTQTAWPDLQMRCGNSCPIGFPRKTRRDLHCHPTGSQPFHCSVKHEGKPEYSAKKIPHSRHETHSDTAARTATENRTIEESSGAADTFRQNPHSPMAPRYNRNPVGTSLPVHRGIPTHPADK